jgi:hypothetical protein
MGFSPATGPHNAEQGPQPSPAPAVPPRRSAPSDPHRSSVSLASSSSAPFAVTERPNFQLVNRSQIRGPLQTDRGVSVLLGSRLMRGLLFLVVRFFLHGSILTEVCYQVLTCRPSRDTWVGSRAPAYSALERRARAGPTRHNEPVTKTLIAEAYRHFDKGCVLPARNVWSRWLGPRPGTQVLPQHLSLRLTPRLSETLEPEDASQLGLTESNEWYG